MVGDPILSHRQTTDRESPPMPQETAPRLSHVGLYVHDVPRMIDFYSNVLGFVVSDGAEDGRITFLSRNPSDHHLVVLFPGPRRQPDRDVLRHAVVRAATLGLQNRPRQTRGRALPRDRGLLPG